MTDYNVLDLSGGFNKDTTPKFFSRLDALQRKPTLVYLMGSGGLVSHKQAVVDALTILDVPITVVSRGYCGSSCALFPHSADFIRLSYPNATFLYHNRSTTVEGNLDVLEAGMDRFKHDLERDNKLFMEQVGLTKKQATSYQGNDKWIYPEDALKIGKHGMLDGIIIRDYRDGRFLIKTREGNKEIDITQHRRGDLKTLPVIKG